MKKWVFWILASFAKPSKQKEQEKERATDVQKGWLITLSDRTAEKKAAMKEWIKPEKIAKRKQKNEEAAKKFLEAYGAEELPPLPEVIPEHMRKQSESTIRALLRQEGWEYDRSSQKWSVNAN